MSGQDNTGPQNEGEPKDGDPGKNEGQPAGGNGEQGEKGGDDADPPGAEHLGDPGKKALETMKAERKAARDEVARIKAEYDAYKAKQEGKEAEHQAQLERDRVQADALAKANQKILKAELRAASAGKLADPADALRFLDLDEFEVDENGEVDTTAVTAAIDDLLKTKPYLAAQGGKRFQGGADGGPRNEGGTKTIDDEIAEATKARDFQRAIALKQKRAADLAAAAKK
ncbi:hypothetical protein [Pseudonocardia sp. NPDC049154]|uniref:hypothetical protein n=1 Tax=Pseudonocardia sp. NPDC049154 TaxID=3155501 RepID=UPI0033D80D6D